MSTGQGWRIEVTRPAARDVNRLDHPVRVRLLAAIDGLKTDPAAATSSARQHQPTAMASGCR